MKNIINGDNCRMNPQIFSNYQNPPAITNFEFNFSKNKFCDEHHGHHCIPNRVNMYLDENINHNRFEISNSSLSYREHSAIESTDDNISMKKYYDTSSLQKQRKNLSNSEILNNLIQKNQNAKFRSIYDKYITQIPHDILFEIWESLKYEEQLNWVGPDFIKNQKDINEKMRAILIDWLVEVHQRFNLTPESLFLTINIIDRYISKREILRTQLQLVGVTALFIACKYEEILCPDIRDFAYITDNTYSKAEILKTEREMLTALNFDVCVPTSLRMFEIISLNFNFNEIEFAYGKYFLESFLIDPNYNKYFPSIISCAIAYIIMKMNNYPNYHDVYKIITCSQKTLKDCAKEIYYITCNVENTQFKAVHKKYSAGEFYHVAINGMAALGYPRDMRNY